MIYRVARIGICGKMSYLEVYLLFFLRVYVHYT
jgi:hypothetical protein